jgi:hypothetical protein
LIEAVIAGKYEWEIERKRAFGLIPMMQFKGVFRTDEGVWTFSRWGTGAVNGEKGSFDPYLRVA